LGSTATAVVAAAGASPRAAASQASTRHTWHLRYAPELSWWPEGSWIEKAALFAEYGFNATEYNWLLRHTLAEVEQMRKALDAHKVQLGIFAAAIDGQPSQRVQMWDPKTQDALIALWKKSIEYANVAGNDFVVTGAGSYAGGSRSDQRRVIIDAFKRLADLLEPSRVTAVVEPVSNPLTFFRTAEEIVEVLSAVGSRKVRLLFDFYHSQVTEGNLLAKMELYWDYIAYMQTGDVPGRLEPGTGEINYRNVLKKVAEKGFKGIVGMEHGTSAPGREGILKCFEAYRLVDSW
jgi:hydroxypyruvate isomerase